MKKSIKFFNNYKKNLISLINNIDEQLLYKISLELDKIESKKGRIFVIGNGGSASTSSHITNDFAIGLKIKANKTFDIESLSDNSTVCTTIANDLGYENIFYKQIENKITSNDMIIAISCSGNSLNILKAVKYSKKIGAKIIGLTGFDGGELKSICDLNYHVNTQKGEYGLVEDLHMIFDHILYSYYINKSSNIQR